MNICFITSEYPDKYFGGVETITNFLIQELKSRGFNIFLISLSPTKSEAIKDVPQLILDDDSNKVEGIKNFLSTHSVDIVINQSHHWVIENALSKLRNHSRAKFIKTVHSDPEALIKGIRDQEYLYHNRTVFRPIINAFRYPVFLIKRHKRHQYLAELYKSWDRIYDRIVLLSDRFKESFVTISGKDDLRNIIVGIPNFIEDKITSSEVYHKSKTIVFVGRMVREAKRPDRMVRIWEGLYQQFPDWRLVMVGDGPLKSELEDYCQRKGIQNVEFKGRTDSLPHIQEASILCCTSSYEGFGLILVEAQQFGTIPMAFDCSAVFHDIIDNGTTGILVKPYSISEYAKELAHLMSDNSYHYGISENIAQQKPHLKFAPEKIIDYWTKLFKDLA